MPRRRHHSWLIEHNLQKRPLAVVKGRFFSAPGMGLVSSQSAQQGALSLQIFR
ncbi:hypothetical protein HM1_1463 [Heliomicrobium modesticaldum Ice1]|uniref:Uncharacterized protein n=1 Tax=Heliobacterium modesticaldum (strain ATCC 51547 / Ice1) TaxID=498761 RepID=B0TCL0_HELMI|nr:hypothetical protein HM1_1463 [Heliomicrobium modesticaldum Ice1]